MNRNPLFTCVLIGSVCLAATFTASAQSPAPAASAAPVAPAAVDEAQVNAAGKPVEDDAKVQDSATADPVIDPHCPQYTRTRIAPRGASGKRCDAIGRVYTQDDIQRTGATDLADALRKLDPAIR